MLLKLALTSIAALVLTSTPGNAEIYEFNCRSSSSAQVCELGDTEAPGFYGHSYQTSEVTVFTVRSLWGDRFSVGFLEATGEELILYFSDGGLTSFEGNEALAEKYSTIVDLLLSQ